MAAGDDIEPIPLPGGRVVPEEALLFKAVAASGPGGQNVNKTASKIELRLDVDQLPLSEREFALLQERLGSRISRARVLVVMSEEHRGQLQNKRAARRRLAVLLAEALKVQPRRVPTRIPRSVRNRIRQAKEQRSARKQARRPPGRDE